MGEVIKLYEDVDFGVFGNRTEKGVQIRRFHGNVAVVKGLVKGEPDALVCVGWSDEALKVHHPIGRLCFYKPMDEIEEELRKEGLI